MDDGDSDTPGGRRKLPKRRMMTGDERALVGSDRRRQDRDRQDYSGGFRRAEPDDAFPDDETTAPERVLQREPTDVELEILRRLGIPYDQVVTMRDLAKLLWREGRKEKEQSSGTKELGRQMDELRKLLETPPNAVSAEIADRVEELEREHKVARSAMKRLRGLAATAIVAAVGSIGTAAAKLYDRAKEDGESSVRLNHVEDRLGRVERQIDRLPDRRKDWTYDMFPQPKEDK